MSLRMLSVLLCPILIVGCGTSTPTLIRPPAPPEWVMKSCQDWPRLPGEGRVSLEDAARAVADAKYTHSVCAARLEGAQHYIREVVKPRED